MEPFTLLKRGTVEDSECGLSILMTLCLESPDSYLAGNDGRVSTHTMLLAVHSTFLKNILSTITDPSEAVVILPDFQINDLTVLVQVISGIEKAAFVSGDILDTLGMEKYKNLFVFDIIEDSHTGLINEIVIDNTNNNDSNDMSSDNNDMVYGGNLEPSPTEVQVTGEQTRYQCHICDKWMKTEKILKEHKKFQHTSDPAVILKTKELAVKKSLSLRCTICYKMFNTREIKNHFQVEHP